MLAEDEVTGAFRVVTSDRRLGQRVRELGAVLFFLHAEDGIRDGRVTGVQTCALPICPRAAPGAFEAAIAKPPARAVPAARAAETARPAQPLQVVQAVLVGAEPGLELTR